MKCFEVLGEDVIPGLPVCIPQSGRPYVLVGNLQHWSCMDGGRTVMCGLRAELGDQLSRLAWDGAKRIYEADLAGSSDNRMLMPAEPGQTDEVLVLFRERDEFMGYWPDGANGVLLHVPSDRTNITFGFSRPWHINDALITNAPHRHVAALTTLRAGESLDVVAASLVRQPRTPGTSRVAHLLHPEYRIEVTPGDPVRRLSYDGKKLVVLSSAPADLT